MTEPLLNVLGVVFSKYFGACWARGDPVRLEMWPSGFRCAVVMGVDDVHPETNSDGRDCGGDLRGGVINLLEELVAEHPQLKVSLFITPAWRFLPQKRFFRRAQRQFERSSPMDRAWKGLFLRSWPEDRFRIDSEGFADWREKMRFLAQSDNFELCVHGFDHFQEYSQHAAEFAFLDRAECLDRVRKAKDLFLKAGLPHSEVFAPPGWAVTDELIRALGTAGFHCLAGSADGTSPVEETQTSEGAGLRGVPLYFPSWVGDAVINVPRNWDLGRSPFERMDSVASLGGLIGVHSHIQDEYFGDYLGNGVTVENVQRLRASLRELERRYPGQIWYAKFQEVLNYWSTKFPRRTG